MSGRARQKQKQRGSSSHSLRAESQSQTFRPHTPLLLADCCQLFSLSLLPIYIRSCTNKCTVSCCCWPFAPLMQSYVLETLSGLRESREMRSAGEMIIIITRTTCSVGVPLCSYLARIFLYWHKKATSFVAVNLHTNNKLRKSRNFPV